MHDVAVIGAGKIGSTIAQLLTRSGDYRVTVMDRSAATGSTSATPRLWRRRWSGGSRWSAPRRFT